MSLSIISSSILALFVVSVPALAGDDHPNESPGTQVPIGHSVPGMIKPAKDRDFFFFSPVAGHDYRIEASKIGKGKIKLARLGTSGAILDAAAGDDVATLDYHASTNETCCVRVRLGGSAKGSYAIRVLDVTGDVLETDDYYEDGKLGILVADSPMIVSGIIEQANPFDVDPFLLTLPAQSYCVVRIGASATAKPSADTCLTVKLPDGTVLDGDDNGSGGFSEVGFEMPVAGDARVYVMGEGYAPGGYTLTASTIADDWTLAKPGQIAKNAVPSAKGEIQYPGDADPFKLQLVAGHHYVVTTVAPLTGAVIDTVLQVDLGGGVVLSDDDGGPGASSEVGFTASSGGIAWITVREKWALTGGYGIVVQEIGDDWTPANPGTVYAALAPSPTAGKIDFKGDTDPFAGVHIVAGRHYLVRTLAALGQPAIDTTLKVTLPGGIALSDDDSGPGEFAQVEFHAAVSDIVSIEVGAKGAATGAYAVAIEELTDEWTDSHPAQILPNGTYTMVGTIDWSGDSDPAWLPVVAGTHYLIVTGVGTDGVASDTVLSVDFGGGNILTDDDHAPGSLSHLHFKSTVTGTVLVRVAGKGAATGSYRVKAQIMGTDMYGYDDHGESFDDSTELALAAQPVEAKVSGGNDETDAFHFEGSAGKVYSVTIDIGTTEYLQKFTAAAYSAGPNGSVIPLPLVTGSASSPTMTVTIPCQYDGACYVMIKNQWPFAQIVKITAK